MSFPFGVPVTFLTQGQPTGQTIDGFTYTPTAVVVVGCALDPGGSSETLGGQDLVTTLPALYCPPGTVLPAVIDQVIVNGVTYEVDGSANNWVQPNTGWNPGVVVNLKAWTG